MQQFTGGFPSQAASTSAVAMKMRSISNQGEVWTKAKIDDLLKSERAKFEEAREDSLELRTIRANPDAVKNVTSDGGKRTSEARIARALANLDSLESEAQSGVTRNASGKYDISPEAISATKQFQALARSTTKLVEATLRGKAELLAKRDQELQAISAKDRSKALEDIRITLDKLIGSDKAFSDLRSSFYTAKDVGPVSLIRQGLARISELERSSKIQPITEADLKEAKSISQNLSILQLPRYKQETLKAQKDARISERQVPVKEALAEINKFKADIDEGLKERNWSASPVKNSSAQTAVGKVAHLRAQLEATAKKIEAVGDANVDGLWIDLAKKQHAAVRKIFDTELLNRDLKSRVQSAFDTAYAIAKEKYGEVRPNILNKGSSDKDKVEFELGKLEEALRTIDKANLNGSTVKFAGSYDDENVHGARKKVKDITGLTAPKVKELADDVTLVTDSQKVDSIYEQLRDIVKQGDGTWSGLRNAANTPSDRLDTPQGKVAQAMSELINLRLEAEKQPNNNIQKTFEFDAQKNYEAEANKIFDKATTVIRDFVINELISAHQGIEVDVKNYWEDIKPAEVYEKNIDKTRAADLLSKASELASTQGNLVDLSLVAQAQKLSQRVIFILENAHKVDTLKFNYDSQFDTAKESFSFPEGYLPAYNPHAKTPQEIIESALGSIRGLVEAAELRRNFPGDGAHIDDSWMSRADDKLAAIDEAYITLSAEETNA